MSLVQVFRGIAHGWKWILGGAAMGFAIAIGAAVLSVPMYRTAITVMPAEHARDGGLSEILDSIGGLGSLAGITSSSGSLKEEALAILRSRQFLVDFIESHELLPALYPDRWDATNKRWLEGAERPTLDDAARHFDGEIRSITEDRRTGLIRLAITWHDPVQGAHWANEQIAALNSLVRKRAIEESARTLGYLEAEIKDTPFVSVREALFRLIESQHNQAALAATREEYAFRIIERARPADLKDKVSPKPVQWVAIGLALGGIAGILIAMGAAASGRVRDRGPAVA